MTDVVTDDWQVTPGNSGTLENSSGIVFERDVDPAGSEFVFRATINGAEVLRKTSADGGVAVTSFVEDAATWCRIVVPITVDESRLLTRNAAYVIERRIDGSERDWHRGFLIVKGSVNDDGA